MLERGAAFLDWALPQLADRRREVVELDLEELTTDEIAARLRRLARRRLRREEPRAEGSRQASRGVRAMSTVDEILGR